MISIKEQVEGLISSMADLHSENPEFSVYYEKVRDLLAGDLIETIKILNALKDSQIDWLTPMFEELSAKFNSDIFIQCLHHIALKYPSVHLIKESVQWAVNAMD